MAQRQWPMYPKERTAITKDLSVGKEDGFIVYYHGEVAVFRHAENDRDSFRMISAQFCANRVARQAEIARAFGIATIGVKRAVKLYRTAGVKGFYTDKKRRGPAVLTAGVMAQAQSLLDAGLSIAEVAEQLHLKRDTLSKAARCGRLHAPGQKKGHVRIA